MKRAIAIDGPSGSGKSTVARLVAKKLGYVYVDTGAMYRAVALYCLNNHIDTGDREKVADDLKNIEIDIQFHDGYQYIYMNKEDVTERIRRQEVAEGSSQVAAHPEVRHKLVELQQAIAARNDVVMDGRDIGTVVLPHADTKIYMTASIEERIKRRRHELKLKGIGSDPDTVRAEIEKRDFRDKNREHDPLRQAEDAFYLDSTGMAVDRVIAVILAQALKSGER